MIERARAPSVSRSLASSLPEGAFDTRTFCPDFLFVFCLSAIAFIEPRDYRVVFVIQRKDPTDWLSLSDVLAPPYLPGQLPVEYFRHRIA